MDLNLLRANVVIFFDYSIKKIIKFCKIQRTEYA